VHVLSTIGHGLMTSICKALLGNHKQHAFFWVVLMLYFSTALTNAAGQVLSSARNAEKINTQVERYVSTAGDDKQDGSRERPWATLQHAATHVVPGTRVHVAPGTYWGAIMTPINGVPNARIRFISDVRWGAIVRSSAALAVWTNDGNFVDIVGFDVSGDGSIGIFNRASGVRIIANHVHHIPAAGCTGNGGAGILNGNYSGSNNDIIGNVVHDIGERNSSCARVQGIYHSNFGGRILNNIAYGNQGYGIHTWHAASNVTIANNLVFNNRHGGILIGTGDAPYYGSASHPADYFLVANNIVVYNQNRFGIEELGVTGPHNRYVNNLVYRNYPSDWKLLTGLQSGTVVADPHFLNYRPDGSGDYHLSSNSPAIGTGVNLGTPSFDIEGRDRPRDRAWDVGPYQTNAPITCPPPDMCDFDSTTTQ